MREQKILRKLTCGVEVPLACEGSRLLVWVVLAGLSLAQLRLASSPIPLLSRGDCAGCRLDGRRPTLLFPLPPSCFAPREGGLNDRAAHRQHALGPAVATLVGPVEGHRIGAHELEIEPEGTHGVVERVGAITCSCARGGRVQPYRRRAAGEMEGGEGTTFAATSSTMRV